MSTHITALRARNIRQYLVGAIEAIDEARFDHARSMTVYAMRLLRHTLDDPLHDLVEDLTSAADIAQARQLPFAILLAEIELAARQAWAATDRHHAMPLGTRTGD